MTETTWTLAKVIAACKAAHERDPSFGQRALDALNAATMEDKARRSPQEIAEEEAFRANTMFEPMTGRRRDSKP